MSEEVKDQPSPFQRAPEQIKLTEFDRKPLACSSPIVQTIGGVAYRVHDGYSYKAGTYTVEPSKFPIKPIL